LAVILFIAHIHHIRQFIGAMVKDLFPEPAVLVDGPSAIDIAMRTTKDGRPSLHLLNRSNLPLPDRYNFTDFIPALGPVQVKMKIAAKPQKITLVPDDTPVTWEWKDGRLTATIPRVHIHSVLVID